ncbi:hypothetical protein [Halomarina rubra]|uniref:Integral membrane protein n=1 Tax=Halomarina rubra TaxID=2071873 RepID=A0ABD6B1G9_9EURY|nr:hypothetical protein [Halomarina rubra]
MDVARSYWLGWAVFGLGYALRGLAEARTEGWNGIAMALAAVGVVFVVISVVGDRSDDPQGEPSEKGLLLYGTWVVGLGMLGVGLSECLTTL